MENKFTSLEGKILVASPTLEDKFFEKSLIYIFMHDKNGALGVILNHTIGSVSNHELLKLLDKSTNKVRNKKLPIVFGGPVNTERMIALSIDQEQEKNFSNFQSVTLHTDIQNFVKDYVVKNSKSKFLLARGISAWDSTQLEDEIAENSWFVVQPKLDLIFSQKIKDKWASMIRELGVEEPVYIVPYTGHA
jgi:putative transcriptional regulator